MKLTQEVYKIHGFLRSELTECRSGAWQFSKSLQDYCYNMHTIFMSWCSLDLASKKETSESLNQATVLSC